MSLQPSEKQQNVYDIWTKDDCNIVVQSVAGSGKTTLLLGLLERTRGNSLFLAFNKSIQTEIQEKIDEKGFSAKAKTLHSLGFQSLRKHYKRVKINNNKNWDIINSFTKYHKHDLKKLSYKKKMSLIFNLMDMLEVKRIYNSETFEDLKSDMFKMGKTIPDNELIKGYWEDVWYIYKSLTTRDRNKTVEIDFLDMVFLPAICPEISIQSSPDYLFIDECQDLNFVQHLMIRKLINKSRLRKWVAVGDSRQSIYGFSGSFSGSFELFKQFQENTKEAVLDVCYRCPSSVIDEANKVYDIMTGFKQDEGKVQEVNQINEIKEDSLVVCRNAAPLIDLYFKLLSVDKKVAIKGEDILNPVIKHLRSYKRSTINVVKKDLRSEIFANKDKKTDQERIKYYVNSNRLENISLLYSHLKPEDNNISTFLDMLYKLSKKGNEPGSIELCTIHKSKGLEKDVVYILEESLIPSPFAVTDQQIEQEVNLKYVARTRAKEELYYLNL